MKACKEKFNYLMFWVVLLLVSLLMVLGHVNAQPTQRQVYNLLIELKVDHPEIVLKQAIGETGCGSTGVGKSKNNLFGFLKGGTYIRFKSWKDSVKFYKKWQEKYYCKHMDEVHCSEKECDYYCFLWSIGYVDGKFRTPRGKLYVDYIKKLKVRL